MTKSPAVVENCALKSAGALALSDAGVSRDGRGPAAEWAAPVFEGAPLAGAALGAGVWAWTKRFAHRTMMVAIAFMITDCTKRRGGSGRQRRQKCRFQVTALPTFRAASMLPWSNIRHSKRRPIQAGLAIPH